MMIDGSWLNVNSNNWPSFLKIIKHEWWSDDVWNGKWSIMYWLMTERLSSVPLQSWGRISDWMMFEKMLIDDRQSFFVSSWVKLEKLQLLICICSDLWLILTESSFWLIEHTVYLTEIVGDWWLINHGRVNWWLIGVSYLSNYW